MLFSLVLVPTEVLKRDTLLEIGRGGGHTGEMCTVEHLLVKRDAWGVRVCSQKGGSCGLSRGRGHGYKQQR